MRWFATVSVACVISSMAIAAHGESSEPKPEWPRPLLLVELGFEYGRYHASLPYDHALRDADTAARLAGTFELEAAATLGTKLVLALSIESPSRFWKFQGGGGLGLRRSPELVERPNTELGQASAAVVPYSGELEAVARLGFLWGWAFVEASPGVHALVGLQRFEYLELRDEEFESRWAFSARVGSGVRIPVYGPWRLGFGGGAALLLRRLPVFARSYGLLTVGFEGLP